MSSGKCSSVVTVFCSLRHPVVRARDLRDRGEIFAGGDEQAIVVRKLAVFGLVACRASIGIHLPNLFCEFRQGYATTLLNLVKRFVMADFLYTAKWRTVFLESSACKQMQSLHAGAKTPSLASLLTAIAMRHRHQAASAFHERATTRPSSSRIWYPCTEFAGDFRLAFFNSNFAKCSTSYRKKRDEVVFSTTLGESGLLPSKTTNSIVNITLCLGSLSGFNDRRLYTCTTILFPVAEKMTYARRGEQDLA